MKEMREESTLDDYFGRVLKKTPDVEEIEEGEGVDGDLVLSAPPSLQIVNAHERDASIMRHPDPSLHIYHFKYKTQEKVGDDGECTERDHTHNVTLSGSKLKDYFFPEFDPVRVIDGMFRRSGIPGELVYKSKGGSRYDGMSRSEIQKMWTADSDSGTAFHLCAEKYLDRYYQNLLEGSSAEQLERFLHPEGEDGPRYDSQETKGRLFFSFLRGFLAEGWKPYRLEWIIYHKELDIAGTIDAVFYRTAGHNTEYIVVDWKTLRDDNVNACFESKMCHYPIHHMKPTKLAKYCVQLHFYAHILRTYYKIPVKRCIAVCVSDRKIATHHLPEVDVPAILGLYGNKIAMEKEIRTWYKDGPERCPGLPYLVSPLHYD